jgi:hypothetical protein
MDRLTRLASNALITTTLAVALLGHAAARTHEGVAGALANSSAAPVAAALDAKLDAATWAKASAPAPWSALPPTGTQVALTWHDIKCWLGGCKYEVTCESALACTGGVRG